VRLSASWERGVSLEKALALSGKLSKEIMANNYNKVLRGG